MLSCKVESAKACVQAILHKVGAVAFDLFRQHYPGDMQRNHFRIKVGVQRSSLYDMTYL